MLEMASCLPFPQTPFTYTRESCRAFMGSRRAASSTTLHRSQTSYWNASRLLPRSTAPWGSRSRVAGGGGSAQTDRQDHTDQDGWVTSGDLTILLGNWG